MDETLWASAIKGLVAAGPTSLVLGAIAWRLWGAYQTLQADYIALLKSIIGKDGDHHGPGS